MRLKHGILIVAQTREIRSTLGSWFDGAGYEVAVATSFPEGKDLLKLGPDVVVAELKLGEYNGLHLADRALSSGVPAVVIGPKDIGLERDAEDLGAVYLSAVRKEELLGVVERELHEHAEAAGAENVRFVPARRGSTPRIIPGRSNLSN